MTMGSLFGDLDGMFEHPGMPDKRDLLGMIIMITQVLVEKGIVTDEELAEARQYVEDHPEIIDDLLKHRVARMNKVTEENGGPFDQAIVNLFKDKKKG